MSKKKRKKIWMWIGIAVGAVVVFLIVCAVVKRGSDTPEVQATKLEPAAITSTVSAEGELRARNQVDISSQIVAEVERVYVEEGDFVKKGQLLCVLDDDDLVSKRNLNRSQYEKAKSEYDRAEIMYGEKLISEAEYLDYKTSYDVAFSNLQQSNEDLEDTRIYSPISGRVILVEVEEGETVMMGTMNNAGTVMFTIADLSAMQAKLAVDETEVVGIKVGQDAIVTLDALPDTSFAAVVRSVGYMASTDETSSTGVTDFEVILDIVDVDPEQRPGMSVSAEIITASRENVITCPLQAIGAETGGGQTGSGQTGEEKVETVFVLEGNTARLVEIKTGISDGINAEITEGLSRDDVVITGPYTTLRTLKDGDQVKSQIQGDKEWQQEGKPKPGQERQGTGFMPGPPPPGGR
jgi:HlyD family secretion protein